MPTYTEESLQRAILDVRTGISIHQAATSWGIPRSTLRSRLKGAEPRRLAASHLLRLSPESEARLVDWILIQESLGFAPTHAQIKYFVSKILEAS